MKGLRIFNLKTLQTNQGQALPQLLFVVGLIALLGLSTSQVMNTITNNRQRTERVNEVDSFTAMMRGLLSSEQMCSSTIIGGGPPPIQRVQFASNPPGASIDNYGGDAGTNAGIKAPGARVDLQINIPFYDTGGVPKIFHRATGPAANRGYAVDDFRLNVEKFEFVQLRAHTATDDIGGERQYEGTIRAVLSSTANVNNVYSRDIGRFTIVVLIADGTFVRCFSQASSSGSCAELGGVWSPGATPPCSFPLKDADCSTFGPDYFVRAVDASGNVTCQRGLLECPQPFGQVFSLVGIDYSGAVPTASCRPYYFYTGVASGPFAWRQTPYGACSAGCGGGTQTTAPSGAECYDTATLDTVGDSNCTGIGLSDPGPSTKACNTHPCSCTQSYSWTVGGNTCTGLMSTIANGAVVGITDSNPPTTGSAYFYCFNGRLTVDGAPSSNPLLTTSAPLPPPPRTDPVCDPPPPVFYASGTGCATCPWGTETFTWPSGTYEACSLGPAAANGTFTYQYAGRNKYYGSWTWWSATSSDSTQQNALCSYDADGPGPGPATPVDWEIRRCSADYQVYDSSVTVPQYMCPWVL